jgi:ATP-binding cassette, subfamily B, bacterial
MENGTFRLIRRILIYARPYWPHIIALFILGLLGTPLALLQPYTMKLLIDSGFGSEPIPAFIKMFFPANFEFTFKAVAIIAVSISIILALASNIFGFISWVYSTFTGEKLVLNYRVLLFNHIQRLSLAYHDKKGSSDSLYRIQYDTQCIRGFLLGQLSSLITSFITLLAMVGVMFFINWQFAIIAICIMPFFAFLTKLSTRRLKQDWFGVKDAESNAMSVIHEVLSSLRVVKAFGQEENENDRFLNRSNNAVKWQVQTAKVGATYSFLINMLISIAFAVFLYLAAVFVHTGKMTLGELTVVLAYLGQIFAPIQSIIKNLNDVQSSIASINRVFSVLDEETEVKETSDAIHLKKVKGGFEFQNVSFSYEKDRPTLSDISFKIKPGDRVGIMGSTGAGKSTLINLLNRFYDPSDGNIKVDGEDIRLYKLADYRKQFSIVLQEPVLFSTTISENIRYGRPEASEEEIIEAAIAANAHNFIIKSKDGYNTLVGERGMKLSGGERQRISLARAFIKNAPVLILDEPTSSLDIKTEALIMDAMERLMEGRTTFMITHRLDTLNSCNIILHLENGKLLEVVRDHDLHFIKNKKAAFLNQ